MAGNVNKAVKKSSGFGAFVSKNMMLFVLIGMVILLTILSDKFFQASNFLNILIQNATIGVVAVGMTFVIITGGIDLSVGSLVALCSALGAGFMVRYGMHWLVAVAVMLVLGLAVGFIQGVMIARLKMPAFIVTLGFMGICRGLMMVYMKGMTIFGVADEFKFMGNGFLFGKTVPMAAVILIVVMLIGAYVLKYTSYGRALYSLGGNREATQLSGINVAWVETMAYTINGLVCAIGAIILTGRLGSAITSGGEGLEMDCIGGAVIGGASLAGGKGTMVGTFIGVIILGVLNNGLNILNVNPFYSDFVKGMIILVAVLIDTLRNRSEVR